jgi:predicted GH43/DUF377 family glycosyl hydrolase
MSVLRSPHNPIIKPKDIKPSRDDFEVVGVFNAGVARFRDEVVLLLRVAEKPINTQPGVVLTALYDVTKADMVTKEFSKRDPANDFSDPRLIITPDGTYLTSISHLRLARSEDGVRFEIEDAPALAPANRYEAFGIEDPRITFVAGTYYVDYVAVSLLGVTSCLASTVDFSSFERHGVMFCPENKDVVIFPEKISGKFYALHRPSSPLFRSNDIWMAESPDLLCWGNHRYLMGPRPGRWDELKVGAGTAPFRIDAGWLEVYHGANRSNRYCLGTVLLDSQEPWRVIARSTEPILEPQADYECGGFFGNVVFSCGLLFEDDTLKLYYGAADTVICYAELPLKDVLDKLTA